jgi:hypothetical protein
VAGFQHHTSLVQVEQHKVPPGAAVDVVANLSWLLNKIDELLTRLLKTVSLCPVYVDMQFR